MSQRSCPHCNARLTSAHDGRCPNCTAPPQCGDDRHHPGRGLTKLLALWLTLQTPFFYLFALFALFLYGTYLTTFGQLLTFLLPTWLATLLLLSLTALATVAVTSQPRWPARLPWRTINLALVLISLPLGFPVLVFLLADQHVAPRLRLIRSDSPLWGWNQLNLIFLPLFFGAMTVGALFQI